MYDVHLGLFGKGVVDFLLMIIKLFSLDVTADPKFQVEGVTSSPTNHSFSQKTRTNDLSYGIKIWTHFSFVLSQSTRLTDRQTDGRTDRILIARPRLHSMQRGKNSMFTCAQGVLSNPGIILAVFVRL